MGYKIGRTSRITETLELVDETGATVAEVPVSLTPDKAAMEFNRRYNAVILAEKEVKNAKSEDAERVVTAFGNAVLSLLGLVFGDEGARTILDFYENAYTEMAMAVFPFISDVVVPEIRRSTEALRDQAAGRYKIRQAHRFR